MRTIFAKTVLTVAILLVAATMSAQNNTTMNKYEREWAEIEALQQQQLPQSLLLRVDSIYQSALQEKNYGQLLKAIIFQLNCIGILEENDKASNLIFNNLKKDAELVPQPAQSILYSMLGQMYKEYYETNRWSIQNRTATNMEQQDVRTWDNRKLTEEAVHFYKLSLREKELLQNEPIEKYKLLLTGNEDDSYQPALYDLLANRALEFYATYFGFISLPQHVFVIDNPDYFADVQSFINIDIQTEDTLSSKYLTLKTFQELLRFHLQNSGLGAPSERANDHIAALIDADLRRINYLRTNALNSDREKLYEEALIRMGNTYRAYSQNIRVLLCLGDFYINQGASWRNNKTDSLKAGYSKAFAVYERIVKDYPNLTDEQIDNQAEALKRHVFGTELDVETEGVQLPNLPFQAQLKFRNLENVHTTVYRLTLEKALYYLDNYYTINRDSQRMAYFIGSLSAIQLQEQVKLPSVSDHQYYATTVKIPPLNDGFYLIAVSDKKDFLTSSAVYAASLVQISPLMAQDRSIDSVMTVMVTDRRTGEPVANAKIAAYQRDSKLAEFTTDKNGLARSPIVNQRNSRITRYHVSAGNRQLTVFNTSYDASTNRRQESRAVAFTDRSIYRPGQTVYFKAILYNQSADNDKKLIIKQNVPVRLRDVNWQIVSEQSLVTNDFGSLDGSFILPYGVLNGRMTIEFGDYGSVSIRAEEYKRPTFEVKFKPLADNYSLNEQITVTAEAKAYAGYPVDLALVQYRVVRNERYPYYHSWLLPAFNSAREIGSGMLKTDEEGNVSIDFKAIADDVTNDSKYYVYTVTVDVTDVNGETRSASTQVNVGAKPLLINVDIPEHILAGKKDKFSVETTNLNGEFTPASVEVELVALKSPDRIIRRPLWSKTIDIHTIPENEFRKYFPFDPYGDEMNPERFAETKTMAKYTLETGKNKQIDLSALKQSGYYKLKLTADNQKGVVVNQQRYFYYAGDKPGPIVNLDQWFTVLKDSGEPGEQVEFQIAGGENKSFVYCEVVHQSRVIESRWIETGKTPQTVVFPIREEYRGGFTVQFNMVQHNRLYTVSKQITVPYTNKMLDVKLATFRDRLLPGEHETWTMQIGNRQGEKETAEIVASLYDASLDALNPHNWNYVSGIYGQIYSYNMLRWSYSAMNQFAVTLTMDQTDSGFGPTDVFTELYYADINWYDATYRMAFSGYRRPMLLRSASMANGVSYNVSESPVFGYRNQAEAPPPPPEPDSAAKLSQSEDNMLSKAETPNGAGGLSSQSSDGDAGIDLSTVATRTNFNETAFFYPKLRTNENGEVLIEFTIPEALTRWKLLSFAHTQDFKTGSYTNELITQKQVAVSANAPRFFRENDMIELTAKVNNLTDTELRGQAMLRLFDAVTMQPVDSIIQNAVNTQTFNVTADGSAGLRWTLAIPTGLQAITYRLTAQAGTHTDGEEKTIPVMTNSMMVTETMPFSVRAGKQKSLSFNKLINNRSNTLRNYNLTLEYTSTPAWYAVQALPYIMEYPYECAEQIFSRYYANSLAMKITDHLTPGPSPKERGEGTLMSNLEKNQELKQVMLEETPWVLEAKNEKERKQRVALLFDFNRMGNEMGRAFSQLKKVQNGDGGFPWFAGNPSNRYITQHIVAGMGHLKKLDALQAVKDEEAEEIVQKGLSYLDQCIENDYNELIRRKSDLSQKQITSLQLHYLYACSFNGHKPKDKQLVAYDYYLQQAATYWTKFPTYEKALAALVLHRNGQTQQAMSIIRSLRQFAQKSEEMGMYWKDNVAGYFWYQAPIETQALLIEAFDEVAKDTEAVGEMKIWLLRNKQTNDWKTTKATAEAIYALLMTDGNLLDESQLLSVEVAGRPLSEVANGDIRPEPGTGYVKTSWQGGDITPQLGRLKVTNPNRQGIAWGGMYWQYFEQLDKITSAETSLRMNKQLFLCTLTDKGEVLQPINEASRLKVGDLVRVRMELRADRDYEYVHMKDMRASGFEPVSVISGHRYQDGLWYYESIKDASTNFFITYLPKGTYVFEYGLRVTHAGDFSNGITTFQCMYAPEFSAHSEGIRVTIGKNDD
ncbi:MAG: hypothetical protein LBE56_11105 [Tannerella sp.]|jgi:uncharacterized protein YfaS (alpha-2-macroglobulin family)|nr:hypothetical protein [Tannerella sp.]